MGVGCSESAQPPAQRLRGRRQSRYLEDSIFRKMKDNNLQNNFIAFIHYTYCEIISPQQFSFKFSMLKKSVSGLLV